jgi:hypothetical protein
MAKRRRVQRDWPAVLREHADSGLSVTAFGRQQAISPSLLYRWRQRLQIAPVAQDSFVELHPAPECPSGSGVAVVTDTGWRLELEPGFDAATLERVLACVGHRVACSP